MLRRKFSGFAYNEVLKQLGIEQLIVWELAVPTLPLSEFFQRRLQRLEGFDLTASERSKELIIDAFCEEALEGHAELKIWKEAAIRGKETVGFVDYLVAPRRAYLGTPLLCVVGAKKDDFEQGMAQYLIGMAACAERNA